MNDFIDLFSGIGGGRLGLERAGFRCVWSCDNDKFANKVYKTQFGSENHYEGDICKFNVEEIPDHDILCAGFPCQSFSYAGKRQGFGDKSRGTLFFEIYRIIQAKKPQVLLLENVRGLLSNDKGFTFGVILESLSGLGYLLEWHVLNSKYWVPQSRPRTYIIGHLRGRRSSQILPIIPPRGELTMKLKMLSHTKANIKQRTQNRRNTWCLDTSGHKQVVIDSVGERFLTPVERERLQGFPDGWTEGIPEVERVKTLGNAMTVNVIEAIGRRLKEVMS